MDFSKLTQNEKLAVYGAVALIVGGIVGYSYGLTALGILAALVMLVVVFLPQFSPNTTLPGSRGSLMVAVGAVGGVAMLLALLQALAGALLVNTNLRDIFFLIAVAGGLLMAWASWQEFQAEGGKFQLGTTSQESTARTDAAAAPPPSEPAPPPSQPAAPPPTTSAEAPHDENATRQDDRPPA